MQISICKRDGTCEPFNADKINRSIERECRGLLDPIGMTMRIATETRLTLYDGMTTEEMDQATINAAVPLDKRRRRIAAVMLVLFILCFTPTPIQV